MKGMYRGRLAVYHHLFLVHFLTMEVKIDDSKSIFERQKTGQKGFQQGGISDYLHAQEVFPMDSHHSLL